MGIVRKAGYSLTGDHENNTPKNVYYGKNGHSRFRMEAEK